MKHARGPAILLAMEFSVAEPRRVSKVLERHQDTLAGFGAHRVVIYRSTSDPTRVLTTIGIRSWQPVRDLLTSPDLFAWFDAVGLEENPAVFAGEILLRGDLSEHSPPPGPQFVVAAIFPVPARGPFLGQIESSSGRFRRSGIRTVSIYAAFDDRREMLMLLDVDDFQNAQRWIERSDEAANWLTAASVGIYPPVFLGVTEHVMDIGSQAGND